jgi:hypothetical protein
MRRSRSRGGESSQDPFSSMTQYGFRARSLPQEAKIAQRCAGTRDNQPAAGEKSPSGSKCVDSGIQEIIA